MIFTLKWLSKYFNIDVSVQKLLEKLDDIGFEVESVEDGLELYKNFVIAKVKSATKHKNSDKLKVCDVDYGEEERIQVVCGAENARDGINVVLASVGAVVPANKMKIKQSKIRDVVSNGMLCSEAELMLGEDGDGIIELPSDAPVGKNFAKYFGLDEVVVDIAITPNRGDAASVYGIARDLEAADIGSLKNIDILDADFSEKSSMKDDKIFNISDKENVSDFLLVRVEGIKNQGHAKDISNLIKAIGNSNNGPLVDISNYGMFSLGRPNHMYDADKIVGKIEIKLSKGGEKFLALNGENYILPKGLTIIMDDEKLLAIAGVIGGESSKVDENTKNILLEVGNFSKASVVKAGRAINVNTDSRYRFERMVDPSNTIMFAKYILKLIVDNCSGEIRSFQHFDCVDRGILDSKIEYSSSDFKKLVGSDISQDRIDACLKKLGFKIEKTGDVNEYKVPSYRVFDVIGKADLTEEVLRISGTEVIDSNKFNFSANIFGAKLQEKFDKLRFFLSSKGYTEQITWSFYGPDALDFEEGGFGEKIQLANPISSEMSVMRQSVFPNLLEVLANNIRRGFSNLSFFEIGKVFRNGKEINVLAGIRCGDYSHFKLHGDARSLDYFDVKGDVKSCLKILSFNFDNLKIDRKTCEFFHPNVSSKCFMGKKNVLEMGKIHPKILKKYDLEKKNVYLFEINLDEIPIKLKDKFSVPNISDLQNVKRDLAFAVPMDLDSIELVNFMKSIDKKNIKKVDVFDNYIGKDSERSLGLRLELQPQDKTFTEQEIEYIVENVINKINGKFQFELKKS